MKGKEDERRGMKRGEWLLVASSICWAASSTLFLLQFHSYCNVFRCLQFVYFFYTLVAIVWQRTLDRIPKFKASDFKSYRVIKIRRRKTRGELFPHGFVSPPLRVALFIFLVYPFFLIDWRPLCSTTDNSLSSFLSSMIFLAGGNLVISLLFFYKNCYYLLHCFLAALVSTSYQGFDPLEDAYLYKLFIFLSSLLFIFLCNMLLSAHAHKLASPYILSCFSARAHKLASPYMLSC